MSANFVFGELDVYVDTSDFANLKKYRDESAKYIEYVKKAPSDYIEALEYVIVGMTNLLDIVLGDGASNKMFGPRITSFDQVESGFAALRDYFLGQQQQRVERIAQYSPRNRAERRATK